MNLGPDEVWLCNLAADTPTPHHIHTLTGYFLALHGMPNIGDPEMQLAARLVLRADSPHAAAALQVTCQARAVLRLVHTDHVQFKGGLHCLVASSTQVLRTAVLNAIRR